MSNSVLSVFCLVLGLLVASTSVAGHHGTNISYDASKDVTAKATVTEFRFANPHVWLFFDTTDEKGNVVHWSGEMNNPSQYVRAGWTARRSAAELHPGAQITITYRLSKVQEKLPDGVGAALVMKILNSKGEVVMLPR
jgi:hypothetical protein